MICSMTAFARINRVFPWGSLIWELRSVNHRYQETAFKLPDSLRALEPELRERLRHGVSRGKLECALRLQRTVGEDGALSINAAKVSELARIADELTARLGPAAPLDVLALMQWPGVLEAARHDDTPLVAAALESFDQALAELLDTRRREGAELKRLVEQRLDAVAGIADAVRHQLPAILDAQRDRLRERIAALAVELDPQRLEQEIALLAQKADVDEELDRLDAHVTEVRRVLDAGGDCGRRLDFLMQELNREANTLSSKSIVSDTTQAAVELKVLIEQMREQIQNIE